jgi:hypothetical protein
MIRPLLLASLAVLVVAVVAVVGCGGDAPPLTCLPGCAADRTFDARAYALRGRFDWTAAQLVASEDVTLVVGASPVIALDTTAKILAVHAPGTALPFEVDAAGHQLQVDLTALAPGAAPVTFTIDYLAPTSDALWTTGPRDDDPARARVVYTDSEPDRGAAWLPAKHDPSDRALWSIELTVDAGEDVIANGTRTRDEVTADGRVVGYALDKPIPTYLMAFAAGGLTHTDRTSGRVPLSLWYRRDLAIDPTANLDAVADAMATFEQRLGPYPWDSYAVVLVPQYGGGMENATITFNAESSGLGNVGFSLNAHELGHHWFGDWVTMRGYDDVWVKEGMATVLEAEAERATRDHGGAGRRFGTDFAFAPGEAVVDPALHGLDKYNTGPYQRAAWVITQIRALVGETAFWGSLRQLLADHALDSLDGPTFVRGFAPALDGAAADALIASLPQRDAPTIAVTTAATVGGTAVTTTLADPAATVIAPLTLTVVDAAGAATTTSVHGATPSVVTVPTGGYLAADEGDVHPPWARSFGLDPGAAAALVPLETPGAGALAAFAQRSAAVQERALDDGALPSAVGADVTGLAVALDSTEATHALVLDACAALPALAPGDQATLAAALVPLLRAPAVSRYDTRLARCGVSLATQALGAELAALASTVTAATAARLEYLMSFDVGAAASLAALGPVATAAPTLRLRERALSRLAAQAGGNGYTPVPPEQLAAWRALFRGRLAATTSQTRLALLWRGIVGLADVDALPAVAPLLRTVPITAGFGAQVVCDAYRIAGGATAGWQAFGAAAQPWATLPVGLASYFNHPETCPARRAVRPPVTAKPR